MISYFYLHDTEKPVQFHNFLNFETVFQYLKLRWETGKVRSAMTDQKQLFTKILQISLSFIIL